MTSAWQRSRTRAPNLYLQQRGKDYNQYISVLKTKDYSLVFDKSRVFAFRMEGLGLLHLLVVVMFGFSLLGNLGNISETLRNSFTFYSFTFSHYLFLNFCHRHGRPTFTNLFLLLLRTFHFYFMTSTFLFLNKISMGQ